MSRKRKRKQFHWMGVKESEMATLISICNVVAWHKRRVSKKLRCDALIMAIRLGGTFREMRET